MIRFYRTFIWVAFVHFGAGIGLFIVYALDNGRGTPYILAAIAALLIAITSLLLAREARELLEEK